jgi:transposase
MENALSPEQRQELILLHQSEGNRRVADRIKAVLLADEGWTCQQIAHALLLSDESIRKHLRDYHKSQKLRNEYAGSKPQLCEEKTTLLRAHLQTKIYTRAQDIREYVRQKWCIIYSVSGMTDWLKRNNYSFHKPSPAPAKADIEAQLTFVETYETLKKTLPATEKIVFMDGSHPTHQTRMAYGWIEKGVRKELPTTSGQKRINLMGALDLENMSLITQEYQTIDAQSIVYFLEKLESKMPDATTIHVVLDSARYHTCNQVLEWVKTSRIKLHHLPPYSPNLNAIERFWKILHENVTNNRYYATYKEFAEAILTFCTVTFPQKSKQWIDRLTDNFRPLKSPISPRTNS